MAFIPAAISAVSSLAGTAGAAITSTAGATAVGALGTAASSLASSNAAQFQAGLASRQAQQAQEQASAKAGQIATDTRQRLAAIRAGATENGFALTGSMSDLLNQTGRQGQLDYLTAVYDGSVQSQGLNATATNYKNQASGSLMNGALGAASNALGGVSQVYRTRGAAINVGGT